MRVVREKISTRRLWVVGALIALVNEGSIVNCTIKIYAGAWAGAELLGPDNATRRASGAAAWKVEARPVILAVILAAHASNCTRRVPVCHTKIYTNLH